ncbi:MAG: UDP-N-acetylmuramate dehydrogenase [Balneolaceae bacterium]|nr:MAG: UDP-N-acetylmuramate dehydrogenase [Balneolaceae bacterium]
MAKTSPTVPFIQQADLTGLNTLGVKAKAEKLIKISSTNQLHTLFKDGVFYSEDPFILGGGSNVLLKRDISRPVLKIDLDGIKVKSEDGKSVAIFAAAGVNWHTLVEWAVQNNFGGIENLALIPGTIGAAPIQNIGAYGVELMDVLESTDYFDTKTGEEKTIQKESCEFEYRDSIFKNRLKGRAIVTGITLRLTKEGHLINSSYRSLKEYLEIHDISNPGIKDVFEAVVAIRKSKLPDPKLIGNAGSFFKNPVVDTDLFKTLAEEYEGIPGYKISDNEVKIPAGWLIEKAGWKGKRVGNVGTYENQALVLVNHGGATGEEIWNHALTIQKSVSQKFGVDLTPEVNIVE